MRYRIFFEGDDEMGCDAAEFFPHETVECNQWGKWLIRDEHTESLYHLCSIHKDRLKEKGLAS